MWDLACEARIDVFLLQKVLSDSTKKAMYGQYGEERMKGDVPPCGSGGHGVGSTYFSSGEGSSPFRFNARNADDIFADFFGISPPYGGFGGGRASRFGGAFTDDIFASSFSEGAGGGGVSMHQSVHRKEAPIQQNLPSSLEDIFKGTTKKMKISREVTDANGLLLFAAVEFCWNVFPSNFYFYTSVVSVSI